MKFNKAFHNKILKKSLADCKTEEEQKEIKRIMRKYLAICNLYK